jgi:hypothetical protein
MRTSTATDREIEYRTAMNWNNAPPTNAITSGMDAVCRRNITAGIIMAEGTATIITMTTEAITDTGSMV